MIKTKQSAYEHFHRHGYSGTTHITKPQDWRRDSPYPARYLLNYYIFLSYNTLHLEKCQSRSFGAADSHQSKIMEVRS